MAILFLLIFGVMFGPPIVLASIGIRKRKKAPETSKLYFILAVAYVVISGGICYSLVSQ